MAAATTYLLTEAQAREIIDHQLAVIRAEWGGVTTLAGLTEVERDASRGRHFLNPYTLQDHSAMRPPPESLRPTASRADARG